MKTPASTVIACVIALVAISEAARAEFGALVDLETQPADIEILGASANARTGYAIATGDFNGDGLPDLAVSADGRQPMAGLRKGEYYIFWGGTVGSSVIDLSTSALPTRIYGRSDDFPLFCSLAACDINDDGRDDLFIGTPLYSSSKGRAYVLLGQPTWPAIVDLQTSPPGLITLSSAPGYSWLGFAACNLDFDGDGTGDLAISAPATPYGEIYVVLGGQSLPTSYQIGSALPGVVRIIDNNLNQLMGNSLASADFDGDGRSDLIIGASGQVPEAYDGRVTILYGAPTPPDTVHLSNPAHRVKHIHGEYADARLGEKVSAFDLNADMRPDLIASAPFADPHGCTDCGEVYLIHDVEGLPQSCTTANIPVSTTRIYGSGFRTHYGVGTASGEFTVDGLAEVVIAGQTPSAPGSLDTVVVAYGNLELRETISLSSDATVTRIVSENPFDDLGWGVGAVDLSGDALHDLVLGAYSWDRGAQMSAGKVYVFFGEAQGTSVSTPSPSILILGDAHPNPFEETTQIEALVRSSFAVSVTVYDVHGRVIHVMKGDKAGSNTVIRWDGKDAGGRRVPAGVYFVKVRAGNESQTRKVVLVR